MQIRALAISDVSPPRYQGVSSYLVNDDLVVDAGSVGLWGDADTQAKIGDVLLTHAHIDHVNTLPLFVENAYAPGPEAPAVHGPPEALDAVHRQLFNGEIWPDFVAMSTPENGFMSFNPLEVERLREIAGYRVTPVAVDHGVPAYGYLVDDGAAAVVFAGDSGPTARLWEVANAHDVKVAAVVMEASFPDEMGWLAEASFHLTPSMFADEMDKLDGAEDVAFYAVHLKPRYVERVAEQLHALGRANLTVMEMNREYDVRPRG